MIATETLDPGRAPLGSMPIPRNLAPPDLRAKPSWRTTKNLIMLGLMGTALVLVAVPLVAVLWAVIERGAAIAFRSFPDFFTEAIPVVSRRPGPGMGPAIVGTLLVTGGATAISVPLGILGAVYLHEYGGNGAFARLVRFMSTVMTGVPSVVMGLFVYLIWTLTFGYSAFGGALALACLMLPVVIGSTEQMLRLVPQQLREAAYALGATKSRTILTVVLPAALPGIITGIVLALARIAGETAPLLFTSFNNRFWSTSLTQPMASLTMQVYTYALAPYDDWHRQAWAGALVLVMLVLICSVLARVATRGLIRMRSGS
jgi:phosphate transport system permease protein